jgi:hypothetical protein
VCDGDGAQVGTFAHEHEDLLHDNFIKVYSPTEGDANQVDFSPPNFLL